METNETPLDPPLGTPVLRRRSLKATIYEHVSRYTTHAILLITSPR